MPEGRVPGIGMVLAAGRGNRLRPLTDTLPKPAIPLFGQPLISRALKSLRDAGVNELHVNLWHLPDALVELLDAEMSDDCPLKVHVEEDLLGTAGGVRNAVGPTPSADILVHNGDVVYLGDLEGLWSQSWEKPPLAVLGLVRSEDADIPRSVLLSRDGSVGSFLNRDFEREDAWTFSGIQWISRDLCALLPNSGCLVADLYSRFLDEGRIFGVPLHGYWADIGTLRRLYDVHMDLMRQPELLNLIRPDLTDQTAGPGVLKHRSVVIDPGVSILPPCVLDEGVLIETGAIIGPSVYAGAGSCIGAGAHINEAVLLKEASVTGVHQNCVFWCEEKAKVL